MTHSSRLAGGLEVGSQGGKDSQQDSLEDMQDQGGWFHICNRINQEEQLGSETDPTTQGSSAGK